MRYATLVLATAVSILAPCLQAQTVVLSPEPGGGSASLLDETTSIELKDGKLQLSLLNQLIKGSANVLLRDRITRTFKSADDQQIEFHECTRSILFSMGGKAGNPKLSGGQLAGRKVTGKREQGRWDFQLEGGKPTPAEERALKQFSAFNLAVDSISQLYGQEPREVGKPWRPDFSALSKVWPGLSVTMDFRVDEVAVHEGRQLARITVGGLVNAAYGDRNTLEARFTGSIIRDVADGLDLETGLAGTVRFQGLLGKTDDEGGGNAAIIEAPLTLKRSVKVTKRRDTVR